MSKLTDYGQQLLLWAFIVISLPFIFGCGLVGVLNSRSLLMVASVVFISPIMMYLLRVLEQRNYPDRFKRARGIFDPNRQSWAFMFGDTYFLSFAMGWLTFGWPNVPRASRFYSSEWAVWSLAIGIVLSGAFILVDRQRYIKQDAKGALNSPTKLWHNYVVFPVLLSLLVFAGIPQLLVGQSIDLVIAVLAIAGFIACCIKDVERDKNGTLKASDQHLGWNPVGFCPSVS